MSDEIKLTVSGQVDNGDYSSKFTPGAVNIDQDAQGAFDSVVSVSTGVENLAFGDVSTEGVCWGRNLDGTNYVTIGPTTSTGSTGYYPFMRIESGETFGFRLSPGAKWMWKAHTAAVKMHIHVNED